MRQREAVQARRDAKKSAATRPVDAGVGPSLSGHPIENQVTSKNDKRRLRNRASVQKCRSRQRERLENGDVAQRPPQRRQTDMAGDRQRSGAVNLGGIKEVLGYGSDGAGEDQHSD